MERTPRGRGARREGRNARPNGGPGQSTRAAGGEAGGPSKDRKRGVEGKRVELGGRRIIKKKRAKAPSDNARESRPPSRQPRAPLRDSIYATGHFFFQAEDGIRDSVR